MGVKGLWDLLSPSARRINIDTLQGRAIAIDASIWLIQFLKAIRDKQGNRPHAAHLLGFFKRLCKLYYNRIRPIIVFDGPPPDLKRRTLRQRRLLREQEADSLKRTAEKLLINFIRRKALKAKGTPNTDQGAEPRLTLKDVLYSQVTDELADDVDEILNVEDTPAVVHVEDSSPPSSVGADDRLQAVEYARERRAARHAYYESIPDDFRGFLAERRRLDDIRVPRGADEASQRPDMSFRERMAMFGITVHDVDKDEKRKELLLNPTYEYKEFRARNEDGEETTIQLPLNAEIDESVFKALPTHLQYRILCQLRDQWLNDLRLQAMAAREDAHVFSNVQIESYIRTIRSNREIEKVKRKMGEETKLAHFGPAGAEIIDDDLGLGEVNDDDDDEGDFLNFYPKASSATTGGGGGGKEPESLEEKIRAALESHSANSSLREAAPNDSTVTTGRRGPRSHKKKKYLALFKEWETENEKKFVPIAVKQKVAWGSSAAKQDGMEESIATVDQEQDGQDPGVPPITPEDGQNWHDEMLRNIGPLSEVKSSSSPEEPESRSSDLSKSSSPANLPSLKRKIKLVKKGTPSKSSSPPTEEDDGWGEWTEVEAAATPSLELLQSPEVRKMKTLLLQSLSAAVSRRSAATKTETAAAMPLPPRTSTPPRASTPPSGSSTRPLRTAATPSRTEAMPTESGAATPPPSRRSVESEVVKTEQNRTAASQRKRSAGSFAAEEERATAAKAARLETDSPTMKREAETVVPAVETGDCVEAQPGSLSAVAKSGAAVAVTVKDKLEKGPAAAIQGAKESLGDGLGGFDGLAKKEAAAISVDEEGCCGSSDEELMEFVKKSKFGRKKVEVLSGALSAKSEEGLVVRKRGGGVVISDIPESPPVIRISEEEGEEGERAWLTMSAGAFESRLIANCGGGDGGQTENLEELAETLEEEAEHLMKELRRSKQRSEGEVSEEMGEEIRELCRAFGVPYVESPGEAEAQAAFLVQIGLAEAVMSDDSDSMVFGASDVFRNFFSDARGVELYTQRDAEGCLGLTLKDLRLLALLLGCDYTLGVKGIGIVNALEVVAVFSDFPALKKFAKWARDLSHLTDPGIDDHQDSPQVKDYKFKHFNYRAQWEFPPNFPPDAAHQAFINPKVNKSHEPFSWALPDPASICKLLKIKAGISPELVMDLLNPVLARITNFPIQRQTLLDTFITRPTNDELVAEYRSSRLKRTVKLLLNKDHQLSTTQPKRKINRRKKNS